jgi:cytochrome b561
MSLLSGLFRKKKPRPLSGQFTATAKWLHWLVAFFMLSVLSVAWNFAFIPPADRAEAIPVHVSIGLIVLFLTLVRLAWRRVSPPPETPASAPGWMQKGAKIGHWLLYALILLQGVIGIWMAALSPVDIRFFNTLDISALAPASAGSLVYLRKIHFVGASLLTATLIGHVAAALWHHFVLRDDVLIRMLPFSGLWQKLTAPARAMAWRFPTQNGSPWPKGKTK